MAKTYKIEGVVFNETGDPLTDSYNYNFYLGQYQMTLGTQTPGSAQYNKTKKIIEGMTKRIKELNTAVKTNADKVKNEKAIKTATEKLKKYEAQAQYAADSQNVKAYESAVASANVQREIITKAGGTPPPLPTIKPPTDSTVTVTNTQAKDSEGNPVDTGVLADDKFSEYTYNSNGTVTNGKGAEGVFVMESDAAGNITPKFYTSSAAGRDAFLKEYAKTGNIESLKAQLIASGYTKQSEIDNGTWATRIDEMLIAYTIKAVSDVKYNGVKEPIGMNAFLKLKKTSKGTGTGTGSSKYQVITTRGDAKEILNEYLTDLIGRNSTPEEEEQFFNELSKAESKAVQTNVKGVVTGSVFSETDRLFLAAKVARKSLAGIDVEGLLKSSKGSQVAIQISQLQDASAAYGQPISSTEALKYVIAGVGQKDAVSKQIERMRLNSMTIYGNLKDHIKDGGTVRDITNQYAKLKERKLGIVIPDSLGDRDVMAAVTKEGGLMSTAEFSRQMQANPLWRQTDEAHDVAADFANTILKSFGFMG
jgi:hypothetical protein